MYSLLSIQERKMIISPRMKKYTWNLSLTSLNQEKFKIKIIFHKAHLSVGVLTMEYLLTASTDYFRQDLIDTEDQDMGMRRILPSLLSSSHSKIRRSLMPNADIITQLQLQKMATYSHGDTGIKEDQAKVMMSSREIILIVLFQRGQNKESKKLKS